MLTFPINHWSGSSIPINSLRFSSPAANRLTRTPSVAGNRNLWTWAGWIKRGQLTVLQTLWSADTATADTVSFTAADQLQVTIAGTVRLLSTQVFRDPGAWMHVVVAFDAANAVAANKLRVYVNGAEITVWTTDARAAIALNTSKTNTLVLHTVGGNTSSFDGYMADIYMIDGAALAPTAFGSFDADGIWQPGPQYAGAYGTNGFFLDTAEVVGGSSLLDSGPNGLTWAPVNFNFTATSYNFHGSYDSPADNYCTLNPLVRQTGTLRGGNLDLTNVATAPRVVSGTFQLNKGKWYWEVEAEVITGSFAGIINNVASDAAGRQTFPGVDVNGYSLRFSSGNIVFNDATGTGVAHGTPIVANDVVMVAFDADNGKLWFGKNGAWFGGGDPAAGLSPSFSGIPMTAAGQIWSPAHGNNAAAGVSHYNFGQRDFKHVMPAGFGKLRASSLDPVAIIDGSKWFDVVRYIGTGAAQSITSLGFQPDLVVINDQTSTGPHSAFDSVRGATKFVNFTSNVVETTDAQSLTAFLANGFSIGTTAAYNTAGREYSAYCWKKGVTPGFDIVTYTGDGTASKAIAHNCGGVPKQIWVRPLSAAGNFSAYHVGTGGVNPPQNGHFPFDRAGTASADTWGVSTAFANTAPTAAEFFVGSTRTNTAGVTYVAYVWSEVPGFSAFGRTGVPSGDVNGPIWWGDFAPAVMMQVESSTLTYWNVGDYRDSAHASNQHAGRTALQLAAAEVTSERFDMVSNGAKIRVLGQFNNTSATQGNAYSLWGRHPFKHGRAR